MFLRLNHQYNSAHTLNLFRFCKHNHHNLSQPCLNSFDLCSCNSIILFHKHTHNHDLQIHIYSLNSQLHMSIHHINKTKALYECNSCFSCSMFLQDLLTTQACTYIISTYFHITSSTKYAEITPLTQV